LQAQERILGEQQQRLDQFDITYQLLDSATRGNKQRIEAAVLISNPRKAAVGVGWRTRIGRLGR